MAKSRKSKGKGGSSILVIIAVLALLASIGVAIYKLSGQHGNGGGNKTCASFQGSCQSGTPKSHTTKCNTCAANECCDPPTCKNFKGCGPNQRLNATASCVLSGCTKNDCCDKQKMCSEKDITCGKLKAVDTSKSCKTDQCTKDECCTVEAWGENTVKDMINEAVNKIEGCKNNPKAVAAARAALINGCDIKDGALKYFECLTTNSLKAAKAGLAECNKTK